jgi:hypothetical protein
MKFLFSGTLLSLMHWIYWGICGILLISLAVGLILFKLRIIFNYAPYFDFWPQKESFNHKIRQRMVKDDQNKLFFILADKYKSREYVKKHSDLVNLIKILYVTEDPTTIPFDDLPSKYVIKANHGQGWNFLIKDGKYYNSKKPINRQKIIKKCQWWLNQNYGTKLVFKEKHYWGIDPHVIIIEELLENNGGTIPTDYKFFVFHGEVKFIARVADRFSKRAKDIYDRAWNKLDCQIGFPSSDIILPKPNCFDNMVKAAEELGQGIDFIRVDFYEVNGKTYFGEFTLTPGGGVDRVKPEKYNMIFGSYW